MKKLILSLILIALQQAGFSQKVYFIYLQTDPQEPFYLKMNEKIISSSASGYLILSKLLDSTYSFSIGFPGNKSKEQSFSVPVNKKDHGYLLKNFGEKGWGLYDLQTLAVQMSVSGGAKIETPAGATIKDESVFTDILSRASDDPSLKDMPVKPKAEEKKPVVTTELTKTKEPMTEAKEPVIKKAEPVAVAVTKNEEPKNETKEGVIIPSNPAITDAGKKEEPKIESKKPVVKPAETLVKNEEIKEALKDTMGSKPGAETVLIKKEEPKEEIKAPVSTETKTGDPQIITEEFRRSVVTRRSESSTTEGFGLVYLDDNGGGNIDTIRLLIPNPRPVVAAVKEKPKEEKKFLDIIPADTVKILETKPALTAIKEEPKEEKKSPDIITADTVKVIETKPVVTAKMEDPKEERKSPVIVPADTVKTVETKPVAEEKTAGNISPKNNCPGVADQNDFFKLRKMMASVPDDDEMISEARKYFKTKCFTTTQVKNMGALFLSDEGKYKFFDAAYPCVSDIENFPSLQSELKDAYYITRFKAMLR